MKGPVFLVFVALLLGQVSAQHFHLVLSKEQFCATRATRCCNGRQDECSRPMLDTTCYCDEFCERGTDSDCCPDYRRVCKNIIEPPVLPLLRCFHNGRYYDLHSSIFLNCNKCTCQLVSPTLAEMVCEHKTCLIRPEVIDKINSGSYGWRASNYSFFWGKSLEEGYLQRAGICKPDPPVLSQNSVQNSILTSKHLLEEEFDSRRKWPRLIRSIADQMDYPASWAISTVDVASDRLSIQSKGEEQIGLSTQNLISCISPRKHACVTSTDRAWWYLGAFGVVSEDCYPYQSGYNGAKHKCQVTRDTYSQTSKCSSESTNEEGMIYRTPPAYRINSRDEDIMSEIQFNGPVQALLHVRDDFFSYKSGVYRHVVKFENSQPLGHHVHRYQAVRIIGWGVDRSDPRRPLNYWLVANSWGQEWGENGYFRIARGVDESEIEMFVVGVWAKKNNGYTNNDLSNHLN